MIGHDIIVVGASLGGVETVPNLMAQLPKDLPAAIFVVMHFSPDATSVMDQIINRKSQLVASMAQDRDPIQYGRIYVAPPDFHMVVKEKYIRVIRGPRENRWRPAIDPMFRSAAVAYGSRVVGAILTGLLDDGTAGLAAVKQCGGVTMVQSPQDALFPDMPRNALENVEVDHNLPIAQMGFVLDRLAREPAPESPPIPENILLEAKIIEEKGLSDVNAAEKLGALAPLGCPECGGPLWEMDDRVLPRFRCHMGHAYTARALLKDQDSALEYALWEAQRLFEERIKVLAKLAENDRARSRSRAAVIHEERAAEAKSHARVIRKLLLGEEKTV